MMRLRVRATRLPEPPTGVAGCIGEDASGKRFAWFAADAVGPMPGSEVDVAHDRPLACPADAGDEQALAALDAWPAWRLTRLAGLELGSGLLVAGDERLARRVLEMARSWGCLWRALLGASAFQSAAEHWIDPQGQSAESLLRRLPSRPDAAIVLSPDAPRLALALAACRDRASVVVAPADGVRIDLDLYPDAHRRGLRLVACRPFGGEGAEQEWAHDAPRILTLQAQGLLGEP